MQTKAKKDYNSMSADEVTQCLSDFYQAQTDILLAPNKRALQILFKIMAFDESIDQEDIRNLQDAVLEKNGIVKIEAKNVCHNYKPEIIAATEARGSNAAEGLKRHYEMTKAAGMQARATPGYEEMGNTTQMKLSVRILRDNALKIK
jgi:hypothetical protein